MNKLLLSSLIALILLPLFYFFVIVPAFAAQAISNCAVTDIGNPTGEGDLPDICQSAPEWPFPDKSPSYFRRIDQGWDLEYYTQTGVRATLPGKVYHQHTLSGASGGGFGYDYPVIKLDHPVSVIVNGSPKQFSAIYYGHTHMLASLHDGDTVTKGQVISNTDPNGVNSSPNWLEIGFDQGTANPAGPSLAQIDNHPYEWTHEGQAMCDWLRGQPCPDNGR